MVVCATASAVSSQDGRRRSGHGRRVTLWANGKKIGKGTMPPTIAMIFTTYAGMDIIRSQDRDH